MDFLWAACHVVIAFLAECLGCREGDYGQRPMWHGIIVDRATGHLVAGELLIAPRTTRPGPLVKFEVDLRTDLLESERANDIPLEGHQSFDISDFHTRLRLAFKGMSPLKSLKFRHAILTENLFNGANQSHDLQVSYNRRAGSYSITGAQLSGPSDTSYTDASGEQRNEIGGYWKTSAEYGNLFGETQTFTQERTSLDGKAWLLPGKTSTNPENFIYNRELETADQPVIPDTLSGQISEWELNRGQGILINERVNPLISGEVIEGSGLDLSGVSLDVSGTAVVNRGILGGQVDLGRRMLGSDNVVVNRDDTVTLRTTGSDDVATRLSLAGFDLDDVSNDVTATLAAGPHDFNDAVDTAAVDVTGDFTIDTAVQGRGNRMVDAGTNISGEGLDGENVQSSLNIGYFWNNVDNNSLVADDLLIIERSTKSGSRTYNTDVNLEHSTQTHTAIGSSGNSVSLSGTHSSGLTDLGDTTVSPIAEGLVGEELTGDVSFNTQLATVAEADFSMTSDIAEGKETLTDGNQITLSDDGNGILQGNVGINNVSLTGGENLDYEIELTGGTPLLQHGESRNLTVNFVGDDSTPTEGEFGRVSRATLGVGLVDVMDVSAITNAHGGDRSRRYSDSDILVDLGNTNYALETRLEAPASKTASATVESGTDFGINGLALSNTEDETSTRFTNTTDFEILDSQTLDSSKDVVVEFTNLDDADPAVVDALEDSSSNAASLAGIYLESGVFASEIVDLTGLDEVMQVIQLEYDPMQFSDQTGAQLIWRHEFNDSNEDSQVAWVNAVLGNSNITMLDLIEGELTVGGQSALIGEYLDSMRFDGGYGDFLEENELSDPTLGAWGVDGDSNKVWAVIDHNSSFAVAIPEPGSSSFLLFAAAGLLLRRKRKA